MARCKITVIKRSLNSELAKEFVKSEVDLCPVFHEGQEFEIDFYEMPDGFCNWAWNDISKTLITLSRGGNFSTELFDGWMKDDKSMITCCTDGIRPVIFKVEKLEN